ncbi:MAG: outer membrane lipoprotein carrier protein LolA [Bacteroidetes bacterium]|nr:outer membrane lipoprotein carrier protein LolA [Bacteroidota bacterium]
MKYLFGALLLMATYSFGQDAKSQGVLDNLSKKMKSQNTFYIEFNANIKNSASGMNDSETGKGWVKGDKFYASYGENTIISNGLKTWTVVKEEKSVYESSASEDDEDGINPKKLMTIWESGFKNKFDKMETFSGTSCYVINLYPKNPAKVDYHTIVLYVAKNENELKKAIMKTKDGTTMTYNLTKFQGNPSVEDSKFVYDSKKYPGYTLIRD